MKDMTPEVVAEHIRTSDKFHRAYLGDDPAPTARQIGAVLHALADHTLIGHLLSEDVRALGDEVHDVVKWRQVSGIGRFLQATGDVLTDHDHEQVDPWIGSSVYRVIDCTGFRVLTTPLGPMDAFATALTTPEGRVERMYRSTEVIEWRPVPVDVAVLDEDTSDDAMGPYWEHDDGRFCAYHARLALWVCEARLQCTREHPSLDEAKEQMGRRE